MATQDPAPNPLPAHAAGVHPQQEQGGGTEHGLQQATGQRGEQLGGAEPSHCQGGQRHAWEQGML